jgi:hypothetical protein
MKTEKDLLVRKITNMDCEVLMGDSRAGVSGSGERTVKLVDDSCLNQKMLYMDCSTLRRED